MYPVSQRFLDTLMGSHPVVTRAVLLAPGQFGSAPTGVELPILAGDVKLTTSAAIKSTLDITVPGDYWDAVQPYGAEVWVARGVGFGTGPAELVPLGYFRIGDITQDNAPYGPVRLSCSDRAASLQQNRVLFPYQVPTGTSHRTIFERLVNGRVTPTAAINTAGYAAINGVAIPIIWTAYDPDRATVDGGQVVQDSTYDFLAKLADNQGCVLRFDEFGQLIVDLQERDIAVPVYAITPGATGNLVTASRKTSRDGVYNIVTAYGSDPAAPTGYQLAYLNDPNSPLRWSGDFGPAPRYFASPLLRTPSAAADAAATVLSHYTGLPTTVAVWTVPNPALRPWDTISTKITGLAENHLIDEVIIPLAGNAAVEITTKTVNEVIIPSDPTVPVNPPTPDPTPTPGGPSPAQIAQEKCFELTSTAENSTIQWWSAYNYLQDIGDQRGYTGGIVGFTSATGDMLAVVQQYAASSPGNPLAAFISGLTTCAAYGMGVNASSLANSNLGTAFKTAWAAEANVAAWRQAQRNYRETVYWNPARAAAALDGVGTLGLALYYDTMINHGPGVASSNDGSFDDIRSRTTGTKPIAGGSETTWLTNWISTRSAVLTLWGDNPANGRISMFTALLGTGNLSLTTPFSWSVYGDNYTMATDPLPHLDTGVPTSPGQAHNIGPAPGQNHFNIGIGFSPNNPFGASAVHHDYSQSEIAAGLTVPGYYEMDNGRVLLTCHPNGGKTSSNTNYSRVEYREFDQDGTTKAAWDPSKGTHYIKGRSAVESPLASAKPQAVLAQMHNASNDTAMIYVNNATTILAKVNGTSIGTLATFTLGTEHDWMIKLVNGQIQFFWDDLTTPGLTSNAFVGVTTPQYFKAGDYMQWNTSNADSTLCKVHMVSLEHWHTGWPQPTTPAAPPSTGGGTGTGGGGGGASTGVPAYDHIVICMMENHDFSEVNSSSAPYLWSLTQGGALLTNSFGILHPSEGNYLAIFAGATYGLEGDTGGNPALTNASIWSQLGSGNACKWYSENKPSDVHVGSSGLWMQWHVAMSYFAGTDAYNLDWTAFPTDFTQLPKVAFVSPNNNNNMHDTDVPTGDTWARNNLDAYAQWARTHNSLLIVTFDESQQSNPTNDIFTVFYGAQVSAGITVSRHVDHYDVLRTIETAFGLPGIGNAASRTPILEVFAPVVPGTGGGGGGGGAVGDGIQAATANNWGSVIDGDEFDYTGAPGSKWSMYDGPGHGGNGLRRPSAFTVAGGVLTCSGDAGGTTGGMAFSREEKYCRVECRMRTYSTNPSAGGGRYHPVLIEWPTSDQWPQGGEYDFAETDCDSGQMEAYLHIPGNDGSAQEHAVKTLDIQNWHNYAFEWAPSGIKGWIDGVQWFAYSGNYIQAPGTMHFTYQLDNFFGTNMCPAKMESQWVRFYTRPS